MKEQNERTLDSYEDTWEECSEYPLKTQQIRVYNKR